MHFEYLLFIQPIEWLPITHTCKVFITCPHSLGLDVAQNSPKSPIVKYY
jgi:hypothetical protein